MLTTEQEKWLLHLDDSDSVEIHPFDPSSSEKFEKVRNQILKILGSDVKVEHRGATSFGISGQGELDIYIPVSEENFDKFIGLLEKIFGKPGSVYHLERARFVIYVDKTKAEVFVINKKGKDWIDVCKFDKYLKEHSEALESYRLLKESGKGLSTQTYYRRKIEFINYILNNPG